MPYPVTIPSSIRKPNGDSPTQPQISADYPFEPHYLEVHGSRMHYVDVGSGDPILILHGNPSWSYIWRNIIPHLIPLGRCIAPDLMGFGRSDKPPIEYRWFDHVRYLEGFIDQLGLRNITLLLHDHGSGLGFHYAMRNENNVKGIAFFEAIIRPYTWDNFSTPEFRELFRRFRNGGVGGEGWQMIVEQNMFIEQLLPQSAGRPLSEREMNYYREPFKDPMSRIPIWRFPRETPIGGEPQDVWAAVSTYSSRLQKSALPKLLLYAKPGALVTAQHLDWAKQNIDNLETIYLGEGLHFLQESSPYQIGTEVARWIKRLNKSHRSSTQTSSREKAGDQLPAAVVTPWAPPVTNTSVASADTLQRLVDQAACLNLLSRPESVRSGTAILGASGVIGVNVDEMLHRFEVTTQAPSTITPLRASNIVGESIGKFRHRWLFAPDDFIASPTRPPPLTRMDPTRPQRFVMLDGMCTFGDGADGFVGFGTGQTFPAMVNGHSRLLATAVGTILEGFGKFEEHQEGTYVYCGTLEPDHGFKGNVMLRVMDPQKSLHSEGSLPSLRMHSELEEGITYLVLRGEAVPSDPVSPNIGPDGTPIGLIVKQGLKLQYIDSTLDGQWGLRAIDRVGQSIGRITAYVTFDPSSASGTALDPVPFTAYDEFAFFDHDGATVGTFTADSSEGRVFNIALSGQPAIRFGGTGHIRDGTGPFKGIEGLMTDNSVVVFNPHVSASVYILRINDRAGKFQTS